MIRTLGFQGMQFVFSRVHCLLKISTRTIDRNQYGINESNNISQTNRSLVSMSCMSTIDAFTIEWKASNEKIQIICEERCKGCNQMRDKKLQAKTDSSIMNSENMHEMDMLAWEIPLLKQEQQRCLAEHMLSISKVHNHRDSPSLNKHGDHKTSLF